MRLVHGLHAVTVEGGEINNGSFAFSLSPSSFSPPCTFAICKLQGDAHGRGKEFVEHL